MDCNLRIISRLAIGSFLLSPFAFAPAYAQQASTDAIIAVVNDDVITLKDLRQYVEELAKLRTGK